MKVIGDSGRGGGGGGGRRWRRESGGSTRVGPARATHQGRTWHPLAPPARAFRPDIYYILWPIQSPFQVSIYAGRSRVVVPSVGRRPIRTKSRKRKRSDWSRRRRRGASSAWRLTTLLSASHLANYLTKPKTIVVVAVSTQTQRLRYCAEVPNVSQVLIPSVFGGRGRIPRSTAQGEKKRESEEETDRERNR